MEAYGKPSQDLFINHVFRFLGAPDENIIEKPMIGVDFSVISVGEYDVIVSVDPLFIVPEYGWYRAAWYAIHVLASDVAVSGVKPKYLFIDLNLPLSIHDDEIRELWYNVHVVASEIGLTIAGGHMERYSGVRFPMVGGGMVIGVTRHGEYVSTRNARPREKIIMVKGLAVETAATLAAFFPKILIKKYGFLKAREIIDRVFFMQSVVEDALTLSKMGLRTIVTSMHDATENGVCGALQELSIASGYGVRVYREKLFLDPLVKEILDTYMEFSKTYIDPCYTTSEGTLIATVKEDYVDKVVDYLRNKGFLVEVIGEVTKEDRAIVVSEKGEEDIKVPLEKPFYRLFLSVYREYLSRGYEVKRYTRFEPL